MALDVAARGELYVSRTSNIDEHAPALVRARTRFASNLGEPVSRSRGERPPSDAEQETGMTEDLDRVPVSSTP